VDKAQPAMSGYKNRLQVLEPKPGATPGRDRMPEKKAGQKIGFPGRKTWAQKLEIKSRQKQVQSLPDALNERINQTKEGGKER